MSYRPVSESSRTLSHKHFITLIAKCLKSVYTQHQSWQFLREGKGGGNRKAESGGSRGHPPIPLWGCGQLLKRWFPWWLSGEESACQCRRHGFDPWPWEDPTCHGPTKTVHPNFWSPCPWEPVLHNYWRPNTLETELCNNRSHCSDKPVHRSFTERRPRSLQLESKAEQQRYWSESAFPSPRASSQPGDRTQVPHTAGRFLFCFLVLPHFCIFFFFNLRLLTLQYCSGFCHTLTWISHGCTCVPHPDPPPIPFPIPSLRIIPVHQPWAPCLMQWIWTGDLFHIW